MKNPKRPTRNQKVIMSEAGLDPNNWLTVRETEESLEIYNKSSRKTRKLEKQKKENRRR